MDHAIIDFLQFDLIPFLIERQDYGSALFLAVSVGSACYKHLQTNPEWIAKTCDLFPDVEVGDIVLVETFIGETPLSNTVYWGRVCEVTPPCAYALSIDSISYVSVDDKGSTTLFTRPSPNASQSFGSRQIWTLRLDGPRGARAPTFVLSDMVTRASRIRPRDALEYRRITVRGASSF